MGPWCSRAIAAIPAPVAGGTELQILEYHGTDGTGAVLAPVLVARKLLQNLKTFSNVGELISELREDFYMIFF